MFRYKICKKDVKKIYPNQKVVSNYIHSCQDPTGTQTKRNKHQKMRVSDIPHIIKGSLQTKNKLVLYLLPNIIKDLTSKISL